MAQRKKKKDEPSTGTSTSVADPVKNWADDKTSAAYEAATKLYKTIAKAYENKQEQQDAIEEYWNIYSCKPDENQQYSGNSPGYIPAVRDCVNARAKRALKQLFPENYTHVEGLSSDGDTPYTALALLEYYIRRTNLKSIVRSDLIAGDTTGQWNLMIDWTTAKRSVTKLVKRNPVVSEIDGEDVSDLEIEDPNADQDEDTETEEITEELPEIVDFATEDLVVIPPTAMNLQKAKAVSIRLRMSPDAVRGMVDDDVFILPKDTDIDDFCKPDAQRDRKNPQKRQAHEAGVRTQGTDKYALIFCVYTKLDLDEKIDGEPVKSEAIVYYAGENDIVGIIKNPLWSGKRPIISAPIERVQGSFFGTSKIEPVKFIQWNLNDFWNLGQDSAFYSLLPMYAVDPLLTPQWANLTAGLSALWPVAPANVKQIEMKQLWKDSMQIVDAMKRQIWESMDVNEAMMGKMPQGRKNNQLMGAMQQEQQINITDHASRYEEEVLNPAMEMLFEFDQQFRTDDIMIEQRGQIGVKASVEVVPPMEWGARYFFRWTGTEFMMGTQRIQQEIAWMNVLKGIPPQQMNGLTLDVTPILTKISDHLFGPELSPRILVDKSNQYTVAPDVEDEILHNGMPADIHEADDDIKHLRSHMKAASVNGDPQALYKHHMMMHMAQLQKKRQMQMAQQQPQQGGMPGGPGGAGPGVGGAPKPGALPAPQRPGGQQPPGAIHADQMADPNVAGRG